MTKSIASVCNQPGDCKPTQTATSVQLVRSATVKISYGETVFLIDPIMATKGSYPGFDNTHQSELRNPLVDLPFSEEEVLAGVDAVILTHTHLDHWDCAAQRAIPKTMPLFVQHQEDAILVTEQGFQDVRILKAQEEFHGVTISRTGARHGSVAMFDVPEIAQGLGSVMGLVFSKSGHPSVYLAGDTVWMDEVAIAIQAHSPEVIVLNSGDARIDGFDSGIIMGLNDIEHVHAAAPDAKIIAVHMDAINHMTLSRKDLARFIKGKPLEEAVMIPADGQVLNF